LVSWLKGLQTHKPVPEDEVGSLDKITTEFPLEHPWLALAHLWPTSNQTEDKFTIGILTTNMP